MDRNKLIADLVISCTNHALAVFMYDSGTIDISDGGETIAEGHYFEREYENETPEESLARLILEVDEYVNN